MTLTPAQNYARTKSLGKFPKTRKFAESFPFELDPFQVEACHALESGKGVLVAAPTGAGKTIVGEFAVGAIGPTTTIGNLYWIRNWQNRMVQHKDWNRSLNFSQWWEDQTNVQERQMLIQLLSEYANINPIDTASIIDKYLTRRLFYEANGNKQASYLKLLLARVKRVIPGIHCFAQKPKNIRQILEQENLEGQNTEKEAIARLCRQLLGKKGFAEQ